MVTIDTRYVSGAQYLSTAILFYAALFRIRKREPREETMFNMGFIFTVVGLSQNIGLWALGLIFFMGGMFGKRK